MSKVKIGGEEYAAIVNGTFSDPDWDGRSTKTITLTMDHDVALEVFRDGVVWSIEYTPDDDPNAEPEEYNNSDYCLAGDITDHRDGTVSVKMGKMTDLEEVLVELYGGSE